MGRYIQHHYYTIYYDAVKIPIARLRQIIQEAWEAVPESYIQNLLNSWGRCQAVIDANGCLLGTKAV